MSRARSSFQIKLLPTALVAALVMLGSTTVATAQSYDQGPPSDQSAPQYESAQTDPSGRVARLAYLSGDVEFAPAGENDFGSADVNRPLTTGDRLLTGEDGRAALELGGAALRIDHGSAFNFLSLNDNTAQVELSQGTLNLRVQDVGQNQTYEIDTPAVAFVASRPGMYRVDVAPNGNGAMVTVFDGAGTVYGENGTSRPVDAGQSYRFDDPSLSNVEVASLPSPDDFDRWAQSRDDRRQNSVSSRYVSPEVVGYDDLDDYGAWNDTPDYGNVWFPTQVSAGWAPYRDGHWAWIEPWGWTWVDDAPWGYAPFHYGRWVYTRDRWGWCPGPRQYRPVYAPALVAFVGGSGFSVSIGLGGGGPVGWFPLGPRDVYVPPYRASRNYFTNVNVTNIRNVYVNKTVINNYYGSYAAQRPMSQAHYAYRNDPRALTAVPRNVFTGAKPVRNAVLHVPPRALAQAQVMPRPRISPTQASLAIRQPKRPIATPARAFDRKVVAKHAPPPRAVPFAARERVIAKQGGAPIAAAQLQQMRQQHPGSKQPPQRVQVVAARPKASKPLPPMKRVQNFSPRPGNTPAARVQGHAPVQAPEHKPGGNLGEPPRVTPARAKHPANDATPTPRAASLRPGELPSARFAHPERNAPSTTERNATEQAQERAGQKQAQQKANQARQAQQRTQAEHEQSRQRAQQEHVQQQQDRADQTRTQQQAQQHEAQARQHDQQMRAQQDQQRAQQDRQRADQARKQQEAQSRQRDQQQRAQQEQEQQRARQDQQRADQARQQREAQARQSDQQQRAQQAQMQQQQQRAQQAQMTQQRQAQQHAEQSRAQQQQHAQPQHQQNQPPPKKKDHDDQDNGH
ncbi:MAG: DUF6600 domain-containing protein [Rhodanobacteraceae bacterium]